MKKTVVIFIALLCMVSASGAANLANPATPVPTACIATGASYFIGGSTITNLKLPMMNNRAGIRVSYAPITYFNFGFDAGTTLISVDEYTIGYDTIPVFNSNFGWYAGGHVKASSPVMFDYVSVFAIGTGNFFWAENDNSAYYGGKDAAGTVGVQVRIPGFGYISAGPHVYMILGENRSYQKDSRKGRYGNRNNVRGWGAIDFFPPEMNSLTGRSQLYASLEFTASPKINVSSKVPVQEFSVALSIGTISPRLYGGE